MQLEGPNSPIEALLAAEPQRAANGTAVSNAPTNSNAPESSGTLAERIRALQHHASRARQQGA